MNLNKAIIAGRVSQAPELRTTPSGQSVATMGVATNRMWTDKAGAKQEAAEFHTVVMWGKTAEIASTYLQKGSLVLVEGRLETRSWTDKSGVARKSTEIIAEDVQFGPRPTGPSSPATTKQETLVHARGAGGPGDPGASGAAGHSFNPNVHYASGDEEDMGRTMKPAFEGDSDDIGQPPF
jgi:single-strand DNA-binding protein